MTIRSDEKVTVPAITAPTKRTRRRQATGLVVRQSSLDARFRVGGKMKKIKEALYKKAMQSPVRKWALNLTGWKWWVWQLAVGGVFFIVAESLLNLAGMTMVPWK